MRQFVKYFELQFVALSGSLPHDAGAAELQTATAQAIFETFIDSGIDKESVMELFGRVTLPPMSTAPWSEELNKRRFDLIDKDLQGAILPAERLELAGLTRIMREAVESDVNLPIKGAQLLHRKLLQMGPLDDNR